MGLVTAALIGGAAAIGSAAISSSGAKKAAQTQAEAQQAEIQAQQDAAERQRLERERALKMKQEAAANINFPTYLSIPEAQKLKQTLEERIAGRGLIDVNAQTSPIAEQIRSGEKRTQAGITSAASARGLGRSSVVTSQLGESSRAAERDITERMSQLELARQQQIEESIGRYQRLGETEAGSQQEQAKFKLGTEFDIADTIVNDANMVKQNEFAIAESIKAKGSTEAAGQLLNAQMWAQGLLAAGMSVSDAYKRSSTDIIDAIEAEQSTRPAAQVAIA